MEPTNWFLSKVQADRNEKQPNMDPRAWLVNVAIVRIELLQKDPTVGLRSARHGRDLVNLWHRCMMRDFMNSSIGDRLGPAFEMAMRDAAALFNVTWNVTKNDNLGEVFSQAARSIRKAFLHRGGSHRDISKYILFRLLKFSLHMLPGSRPRSKRKDVDASESDSELAIAYTFLAFLTSVLHLLTSVFQYLIGYVDRGGSKTYSSGAFDFRASFVALVLFQGAYVWIKFRQAARPDCRKRKAPDVEHEVVDIEGCNLKGLHKRSIKNASGAFVRFKYEPRFIPPRQEEDDNTDLGSKRLPLGEYHTPAEAQIVLQIARYYYAKHGGYVELEDGRYKFPIPPMSEQERGLRGKAKRIWVQRTAKQVGKQIYVDFEREKGKHLAMAKEAGSHRSVEINDPSSPALQPPCSSLPMLTTMVAESAIASTGPSSPSLPMLPFDGAIVGDAADSLEALSGLESMLAEFLPDPGMLNLPEQQLSVASREMQYQEFAQFLGEPSLPEVGGVAGGIEHVPERELNPSLSFQQGRVLADAGTENIDGEISLQQSDQMLQQVVFCQRCLGDNARQFVRVDRFKASQIQISKLQQENESLKSRLQQVASLSCNVDWTHDGHSTQWLNDMDFFEK